MAVKLKSTIKVESTDGKVILFTVDNGRVVVVIDYKSVVLITKEQWDNLIAGFVSSEFYEEEEG